MTMIHAHGAIADVSLHISPQLWLVTNNTPELSMQTNGVKDQTVSVTIKALSQKEVSLSAQASICVCLYVVLQLFSFISIVAFK